MVCAGRAQLLVPGDVLGDEIPPVSIAGGGHAADHDGRVARRAGAVLGDRPISLVVDGVEHVAGPQLLQGRGALHRVRLLPGGLQGGKEDRDQDRDDPDDDQQLDQGKTKAMLAHGEGRIRHVDSKATGGVPGTNTPPDADTAIHTRRSERLFYTNNTIVRKAYSRRFPAVSGRRGGAAAGFLGPDPSTARSRRRRAAACGSRRNSTAT